MQWRAKVRIHNSVRIHYAVGLLCSNNSQFSKILQFWIQLDFTGFWMQSKDSAKFHWITQGFIDSHYVNQNFIAVCQGRDCLWLYNSATNVLKIENRIDLTSVEISWVWLEITQFWNTLIWGFSIQVVTVDPYVYLGDLEWVPGMCMNFFPFWHYAPSCWKIITSFTVWPFLL